MLLHLAAQDGALLGAQLPGCDTDLRADGSQLALLDRAAQLHQLLRGQLRLGLRCDARKESREGKDEKLHACN